MLKEDQKQFNPKIHHIWFWLCGDYLFIIFWWVSLTLLHCKLLKCMLGIQWWFLQSLFWIILQAAIRYLLSLVITSQVCFSVGWPTLKHICPQSPCLPHVGQYPWPTAHPSSAHGTIWKRNRLLEAVMHITSWRVKNWRTDWWAKTDKLFDNMDKLKKVPKCIKP